ncbi:MAG: diguanylate cyclase [Lachnospiraceae bacterium]|nr:diguanylate cyclase [Lachnospiraceae bacterium]
MKHILVVDDNKVNLVSARNVLGGTYKITAVTMGSQAIKFLENNQVDLILLDKNMPEMDGITVMFKIKGNEATKFIPIIILTSEEDAGTESLCIEAGAVDFIAKPFVPEVMRSRIGRILETEELRKSLESRLKEKTKEVTTIKSKSQQDSLTGLWNRAYTEEKVNEFLDMGISGALFMLDMDNFKSINDTYGHIAGDNTLKMLAQILRENTDEGDILCRIGGDEYVAFIRGDKSKEELGKIANSIIDEMVDKMNEWGFETNSSVSIGIAQAPDDSNEFETLYNAADKSLYYVKQNGKNSYHFFSEKNTEENMRASKLVDLSYIKEFMDRADPAQGAYLLDFENFRHVYNFVRRCVERGGRHVQTVLFTLSPKKGVADDAVEMETALDYLDQAIFTSLRRMDVSTRYSSKQVIVILMDAGVENGDDIAQRIIGCYNNLYPDNMIDIDYEIVEMEGK